MLYGLRPGYVISFQMKLVPHYSILISISCLLLSGCARNSPEPITETAASRSAVSQLVRSYGQRDDSRAEAYLGYLGTRLISARPDLTSVFPAVQFVVLNTDLKLAGTPGGGFIVLSKGLILSLQNEGELAFVVAHELSHLLLRHPVSSALASEERYEFEEQADRYALGLIALAGYDPRVFAGALEHSAGADLFDSNQSSPDYPKVHDRIAGLQSLLAETHWSPPGTVDRRDFQLLRKSLTY